jgi:cytochrome c
MHRVTGTIATGLLALAVLSAGAWAADAENGRVLYAACMACHTEQPDALGPSLKGVVGRPAAALEDYRYSPAMQRANIVWDEANLREYLLDPQTIVKGNRMPFSGLPASDVEDLIAYLRTL